MNTDSSYPKWLYCLGLIPTIWLALLIAPSVNGGLPQIMKDFSDVTLEVVDCDEHEDIAQKYNIRNLPTLVYLKNNKEVGRLFGAVPASKIVELLNK